MKERLIREITDFVLNDPRNRFDFLAGERAYDAPIIRTASADDPLFAEFKTIIDRRHLTPKEAFELERGAGEFSGGSVVSVVMPYTERVRASQRGREDFPSREWTLARTFADARFRETALRDHVIGLMKNFGYRAVAPAYNDTAEVFRAGGGFAATWSERHVAYAAGLGTFGLNDALITESGICVKLISFVTDCVMPPDAREARSHNSSCLFFANGTCGVCASRCPAGAITESGHDKLKCYALTYGDESKNIAEKLGADRNLGSGCALCQCGVPCESTNPRGSRRANA